MRENSVQYTDEIAKEFCLRLCLGGQVRSICRRVPIPELDGEATQGPEMPSEATIYRWITDGDHGDFTQMYYVAREIQAERMMDELVEMGDRALDPGLTSAQVQGIKVACDTRKWAMSKLRPQRYGDRIDVNHGAGDTLRQLLDLVDANGSDCGPGPSRSRRQAE